MVDDMNSLMNVIAGLEYTTDTRLSYMEFSEELTVANAFFNYDFSYTSGDDTVMVPYSIKSASGTPTDIPSTFTIDFTPVSSAAKVTVSSTDSDVTVTKTSDTSCTIAMNQAVVTDAKTVTLTVTVTNGAYSSDYTLNVQPTRYVSDTASASIYAFLPAPGQFTNENVTTGGWGDAYNADGSLKMNDSTGMSLGYFGGYVVYKFDKAVENKATNPYGADFIVYGNAFWGNSEPGCIQVSPDGENWYDIAGSRYYNDDTVKNYSLTYKNPDVTEDAGITAAGSNLGTLAPVTFTGSASGTITTNSYHNHSWFPLNANYFAGRYGNAALDKVSELPFASRTLSNGVTDTLTLSGVKLSNVSTSDTAGYSFGYCDVHPNKELGGSVAYNPYQSFTSSSDYSTKTEGTSGGDPIDISWAVNADGTPADLDSIQYVRIYTGAAQMNGIFGEISTEALGVAACTGTGSTSIKTPTITVGGDDLADVAEDAGQIGNMGTVDVFNIDADSVVIGATGTTYTCINGVSGTSQTIDLSDGAVHLVQIIAQDGTASPYVTVLRLQK